MKKYLSLVLLLLVISYAQAQNSKVIDAFALSYSLETKQAYSSAIRVLEPIVTPTDYAGNLRLGWLYYLNNNYDQSLAFYNKALALEPKSIQARFGLAFPLAALKQWDKLASNYEELLKVNPNNTVALYRMGYMYYNLANYEKASKYLKALLDVTPFDYYGNLLKGWNDLKMGKYKDAEDSFNLALCYSPEDSSALEGLKMLKK
jgi:tetratricopeptide (TPR) repeat protein